MSLFTSTRRAVASSSSSPLLRTATAASRFVHRLPPLPAHLATPRACEPLFPVGTLHLIWNIWHDGLLEKLNEQVKGTEFEHSSIVETVIGTAQDPHKIRAFNLASQALNNAFFINGLRPKDTGSRTDNWGDLPSPRPPIKLLEAINASFDSLPAFKDAFSATVEGMAGSGWVWLAMDRFGALGVVPTFAAGTVLVQNRQQRGLGGALPSINAAPGTDAEAAEAGRAPSITYSPSSDTHQAKTTRTGEELYPLLCVSVHEHAWLPDYGMHGKEEYMQRYWESVDWQRAGQIHAEYRSALNLVV